MDSERLARIVAAVCTALVVLVLVLMFRCSYLSYDKLAVTQAEKGEIVLEEEEFVDIMDMPPMPDMEGNEPAQAQAEEQMESQPTPVSGTDVKDAGNAGKPQDVVVKKEESPVKVNNKKDDKQAGATEDKKKKEEEEIKRQAGNEVANAFNKSSGKHNNATGSSDKGNSGSTNGTAPQGTLTGHGSGSVGGGWVIPNYGAVKSPVTGSVKMIVKIDKEGKVISVTFNGGQAPAATNKAVQKACENEVRSRRFTRPSYQDAEGATAYITYTFK